MKKAVELREVATANNENIYSLLTTFYSIATRIFKVWSYLLFYPICYAVAAQPTFCLTTSGDFDQKPYVSGDADCSITQLIGDEDYILLACDGFFDAVKPSEVPQLVLDALQQPDDPEGRGDAQLEQSEHAVGLKVAQQLVGHAKAAGSTDNITVILVFLRPPEQLLAPSDSRSETTGATRNSTSQNAP